MWKPPFFLFDYIHSIITTVYFFGSEFSNLFYFLIDCGESKVESFLLVPIVTLEVAVWAYTTTTGSAEVLQIHCVLDAMTWRSLFLSLGHLLHVPVPCP